MKTGTKLILTVVGGASAFMLFSLANTSKAANKLDFKIDAFRQKSGIKLKSVLEDIIKLKFDSLLTKYNVVFDVDLSVQNPSNTDIEVTHPYLKVFYNGVQIGNSAASPAVHLIKAKAKSYIKNIEVDLIGKDLFSVMPDYVKYLLGRFNGNKSTRSLKVLTLIELNGISMQQETEVKI
jgi:hypothetical protein